MIKSFKYLLLIFFFVLFLQRINNLEKKWCSRRAQILIYSSNNERNVFPLLKIGIINYVRTFYGPSKRIFSRLSTFVAMFRWPAKIFSHRILVHDRFYCTITPISYRFPSSIKIKSLLRMLQKGHFNYFSSLRRKFFLCPSTKIPFRHYEIVLFMMIGIFSRFNVLWRNAEGLN